MICVMCNQINKKLQIYILISVESTFDEGPFQELTF